MPYSEFIYEPSDINDEMFLSKVPLEIIEESIQNQFINPWEYRKKDYVQTVITKYVISKDNMVEDELEDLERLNEDFISFMLRMFDIYLDIGVNDIDILEMDDQHELIHLTYRFFIKNMKKNFVNLIINYINENKSELYDDLPKKKDVTSLHFKSEIDNEEEKYRFYRKYSNSCRSTMFLIFMCMAMCAVAAYLQWVFRGYLWGFALCGVVFLIAFIVFCMYGRMLRNSKKTARMLQAKLRTKERRAAFYAQHSFETDETEEELDTDWNTLEQTSQTQKLRRRSK